MPPGGQDITEHLTEKYGSTPEQQAQIRETIRQRGAEVGFTFRPAGVAASGTPSTRTVCCTGPAWKTRRSRSR
jgi:predicted DsbA family dithiol-disulfide isomerase